MSSKTLFTYAATVQFCWAEPRRAQVRTAIGRCPVGGKRERREVDLVDPRIVHEESQRPERADRAGVLGVRCEVHVGNCKHRVALNVERRIGGIEQRLWPTRVRCIDDIKVARVFAMHRAERRAQCELLGRQPGDVALEAVDFRGRHRKCAGRVVARGIECRREDLNVFVIVVVERGVDLHAAVEEFAFVADLVGGQVFRPRSCGIAEKTQCKSAGTVSGRHGQVNEILVVGGPVEVDSPRDCVVLAMHLTPQ